jgi:hypothetical protein
MWIDLPQISRRPVILTEIDWYDEDHLEGGKGHYVGKTLKCVCVCAAHSLAW